MRQRQALKIMLDGHSVFLTGAPGAGKTYVLNEFIRRAQKLHKNVAVTASTGIAATHIGGTTIHSWSGLGIREELNEYDKERLAANNKLVKRYNAADVLVIDEVSMLHGHRLDMVNQVAKLLRKSDAPFGSMQVILVGDLFQLPPVMRGVGPGVEKFDFVHTSEAWLELAPKICYLSEQHRQAGSDGLLELLEAMRRGDVTEEHVALLGERLHKGSPEQGSVTRLYAHNADVETINQQHLAVLDGEGKVFNMQTKGAAAKVEQLVKSVLAPEVLELKKGAEVMFVANNFAEGFVNGSRGRVVDFNDRLPLVQLQNGRKITVEPHNWTLTEDGRTRAEAVQLPLRLAWAITIHKSQGMSLDAAEIDLSRTFTPGMGYVALSRVRSLDGVFLRGVNAMALEMQPEIYEFDTELKRASAALALQTDDAPDEAEETIDDTESVIDEVLFQKLKDWRFRRAQTEHVPAYIIAHNTVLEAIATRPPQSAQALLGLKGFGPKKFAAYGPELLTLVTAHTGQDIAADNDEPSWTADEDRQLVTLFQTQTPLAEAAKLLGREPADIWQHLSELPTTAAPQHIDVARIDETS